MIYVSLSMEEVERLTEFLQQSHRWLSHPTFLSPCPLSLFPSLSQKPWACSSSAYFISWAAHHSGTPPSSQQQCIHTRMEVTEAWVNSHWLEVERCSVGRWEGANIKHSWPSWITRFLLRTCQRNPNWKQENASQCSPRTSSRDHTPKTSKQGLVNINKRLRGSWLDTVIKVAHTFQSISMGVLSLLINWHIFESQILHFFLIPPLWLDFKREQLKAKAEPRSHLHHWLCLHKCRCKTIKFLLASLGKLTITHRDSLTQYSH